MTLQEVMHLQKQKDRVKWQLVRGRDDERATQIHLHSVRQRGRTGSCHLPLIANVLSSCREFIHRIRFHIISFLPMSKHQGGSHHISLNHSSILRAKRWQSERDSNSERDSLTFSPHLKRTNTNTFLHSIYTACLLPVVHAGYVSLSWGKWTRGSEQVQEDTDSRGEN